MRFHIMTLFPDMIANTIGTSIIKRAMDQGIIQFNIINIRDYSDNKHKKVDDYTYGGGAGMLMTAQPIYDAYKHIIDTYDLESDTRVIYATPQGKVFRQKDAVTYANEQDLIFLCGHYEGVDERVLSKIVTDRISIGDYIVTGGELPVMVMVDAISRMVSGVLTNEESGVEESHSNYLLEYPQYSRPAVWEGMEVPDVLLSGHHSNIQKWRFDKSLELTKEIRPDLYEKYVKEMNS